MLVDHPPDVEDARTALATGVRDAAHVRQAPRSGGDGIGHRPVTDDGTVTDDHDTLLIPRP